MTAPTSVTSEFTTWLKAHPKDELSDQQAATDFATELWNTDRLDELFNLAVAQLAQIASVTWRTQTKQVERQSRGVVKPSLGEQKKLDPIQTYNAREFNINPAPVFRPESRTRLQRYQDGIARAANQKAMLRARLELDAESVLDDIELTAELLKSTVKVGGTKFKWGDLDFDLASERFETLFAATAGDYGTLVFLRAMIMILSKAKGKTLSEIAASTLVDAQ